MKILNRITGLSALAVAASLPVAAMGADASFAGVTRARALIGDEVRLEGGREIGEVKDLVLDLTTGRMLYAVVETDNRRVGVPPGVITGARGNTLRVQGERDQFRRAPEFSRSVNQNLERAEYVHNVYQHFGQTTWWKGERPADQGSFENVHKLSDLLGTKVNDTSNQQVGTLNNVALDLQTGRILYVFLEPAEELNLGRNLYPIPPSAITPNPDKNTLTSDLSREKLASAPSVQNRSWNQVATPSFASQVYQHYGKRAWFTDSLTPTGRQPQWQDEEDDFFGNERDQRSENRRDRRDRDDRWERQGAAGWGTPPGLRDQ